MIGIAIIVLAVLGAFSALAGVIGREMRQDVPKRDAVADLYMGPRASSV